MFKHIILMIIASLLLLFLSHWCAIGLHWFGVVHHYIANKLNYIIAGGQIGHMIKQTIALMFIPVVVTLLIGGIYYSVKHRQLQGIYTVLWVLWIIMATCLIAHVHAS